MVRGVVKDSLCVLFSLRSSPTTMIATLLRIIRPCMLHLSFNRLHLWLEDIKYDEITLVELPRNSEMRLLPFCAGWQFWEPNVYQQLPILRARILCWTIHFWLQERKDLCEIDCNSVATRISFYYFWARMTEVIASNTVFLSSQKTIGWSS